MGPDQAGRHTKLDTVVDGWVRDHPQHAVTLGPGRQWRPNVQVHFPDGDGVLFFDQSNNIREINVKDGIDVLTSLHGLDFDECISRAYRNEVDGMTIHSLCPDDLECSQQT